ncbi:MAG: tRNA pseudouridine(55) synthase TruB [Patescibacteria group bacterium]|nr:tRNA pseudouridine(55) synthase TruB [Patescibacteria group bacterium]
MKLTNIVAIYKPKGPTSHDIIDQLRKITGIRRIGHAGTLDPLASGVLVVGISREGTKQLAHLVTNDKEYLAEIKLGENSQTDDAEGEKTKISKIKPKLAEINKVIKQFIGEIEQVPPIYSAIKIKGKSAYKYARVKQKITLEPRKVRIDSIEIKSYDYPILKLLITTGSGVYIRSLARDIGEKLKVGGYLYSLERTRVGEFNKKDSLTIEEFKKSFACPVATLP